MTAVAAAQRTTRTALGSGMWASRCKPRVHPRDTSGSWGGLARAVPEACERLETRGGSWASLVRPASRSHSSQASGGVRLKSRARSRAMAALVPAFVGVRVTAPRSRASRTPLRRGAVCVRSSAAFIKVLTLNELKEKNGRAVVEVNGKPVLLQELGGEIYAVRRLAHGTRASASPQPVHTGFEQVPAPQPVHAR